MKFSKLALFLVGLSLSFSVAESSVKTHSRTCMGPFYLTTSELHSFKAPPSDLRITVDDLKYWDGVVDDLSKKTPLKRKGENARFYAYLYNAQKAFADCAFELTTAYSGSVDPISSRVIGLFYPEYRANMKKDPFSDELSAILFKQIKARYELEEKNIRAVQLPNNASGWKGENPPHQHVPTLKPWSMQRVDEFKSPKPPAENDPSWDKELEEVKKQSKGLTDFQKKRSYFWAGMTQENPEWKDLATAYMNQNKIPFEMQLEVRAKLTRAIVDATIAVFHDKFIYMVKRPDMRDTHLKPLFKTPNHPSYPGAHSTISTAAETVLSYYFPENQKEWSHLADEASQSRIWAGIHFPIDIEAGVKQGKEVGKAVLFRP